MSQRGIIYNLYALYLQRYLEDFKVYWSR